MRKDYLPSKREESGLDEIERVERHWTALWDERGLSANLDAVLAARDEYRIMMPWLERMKAAGPVKLLDAGCGMGEWTVALSRAGYEVHGVDISRATVERLRKQFPNLDFRAGDIRSLDYANGFFDAVFSWGVFEHFEEGLGACIAEARRVLRPGGLLFMTVPFQNWRHLFRDLRPLRKWDGRHDPAKADEAPMKFYQWRLTKPEVERELAIHGFRVKEMRPTAFKEGLSRSLELDLKLRPGSFPHRAARRTLGALAPRSLLAHMIMAVAEKAGPN